MLDDAPCGFVSFVDDGTVIAINNTLLRLLGRSRETVEGRHIAILLTVGSRIFYQTHLFPLLKMRGNVDEIYVSLLALNGDDVPVLLNAIRRERGGAELNDCIVMPMRQRDRFEEELLNARKTAEEAVREKGQAYTALAAAHEALEEVNVELETQAEELQTQQEHLLELNSELYERAKREALLRRIGQSLRVYGKDASETVLEEGVALLANALEADRGYFVEYNFNGAQVRVAADWSIDDLDPMISDGEMAEFHRAIAESYSADGVLVIDDFEHTGSAAGTAISVSAMDAVRSCGLRSLISIALFSDGIITGSLNVAMANGSRSWTALDIELVQAVATLTRLAVEEARLREQSRRVAEQLQGALQPALPRNVLGLKLSAFYQPALTEASVGGDFYDVFPLKANCYALVVADLSGKGLKAAAQIAIVRHMLRTLLYDLRTTISQAVTTLNGLLVEHELIEGFATLFVGVYDVGKLALRYVNAGQEPGLLYRRVSRDIVRLNATGPVLGVFPGAAFGEDGLALASGDVLALFSDGLTEAGVDRQNMLEVDGLETIFARSVRSQYASVDDIADRTIAGVTAVATPAGIKDDVCLLIAQVA